MAVPTKITLYQNNDQFIEVDNLADGLTGTPFNAATVTATLVDTNGLNGAKGATVTGFPLTLTYVAASVGVYRGKVLFTTVATLKVGGYTMKFDALQAGTQMHVELGCTVAVRKS